MVVAGHRKFFSKGLFFIFWILVRIRERAQKLGHIMLLQETLLSRDDPVTHLRPLSPRTYIARIGSNDIGLILTRISASFGAVTREVNQNGNWIRVMWLMESFARPQETCQSVSLPKWPHPLPGTTLPRFGRLARASTHS
jgi:hypothetical protein